jgi:hypothetical protein
MFINNKYSKVYYSIIGMAESRDNIIGYSEKHHIIPKSLGGTDTIDNLVNLTAREHFICHWLLTKMCGDIVSCNKMIYALYCMRQRSKNHQRYSNKITARVYENLKGKIVITDEVRQKISKANVGKKKTDSYKQKMSEIMVGENNHFYGKTHDDATKVKISESLKGRIPWNKGTPMSDDTKKKLSEKTIGRSKKPHSEETKEKMRKAKIGYIPWNKGISSEKYVCVHCGKECNLLNLKRWHNTNCKSR